MNRRAGFSLIEVLIVLVLLAVLATIAMPSYQAHLRRARRAEAIAALLALQQAQERWRASHAGYAEALGGTGLPWATQTPSGRHTLSTAVEADTRGFAYTVTAVSTQPAGDACAHLQLHMLRGQLTQRSGPNAQLANTGADNRSCWGQ